MFMCRMKLLVSKVLEKLNSANAEKSTFDDFFLTSPTNRIKMFHEEVRAFGEMLDKGEEAKK